MGGARRLLNVRGPTSANIGRLLNLLGGREGAEEGGRAWLSKRRREKGTRAARASLLLWPECRYTAMKLGFCRPGRGQTIMAEQ